MGLSYELISQFAKVVKDTKKQNSEYTVYGQVVTDGNGNKYVKLDGSDQLTPLTDENRPSVDTATANVKEGDRVSVLIKNHTATVTGNVSSPAVRNEDFEDAVTEIKEFDIVLANKIQANEGYIKELQTDKASVGDLTAANAEITNLKAKNVDIEKRLTASEASITDLDATKLDAEVADIKYATVKNLNATSVKVDNLSATHAAFETVTTNKFVAVEGSINDLDTKKLSAEDAKLTYANIDFSNIGEAAITKLFTDSGIIKDLIVSEGHITGELVGVTIKGDIIEGGTVKADKLVVKGSDGLFYKLNTDGVSTTAEQTEYNSLNGSVIIAKSITAEKVNVDDLVAFDATIGGLNITDGSIYSGVKSSIDNTTKGFYLDKDGQLVVGDTSNFIKYYKDQNGNYKLEISANNISIRSGESTKSVESAIEEIETKIDTIKDEITTLLRIESSRGTVFKNDTVATVLSVVIYHGKKRITNSSEMIETFGNGAYLQWKWQRLDDDSFGVISSSDSRFGDNGFTFTLSPEDVDTKITFMCELIV